MAKFSDLSNELVLMIWDLVEVEDVYSFSTISKNVYLLTHDLLREHYRLEHRLSTINYPCSELTGPGVYGRVLKEVLLIPRASRYPSSLKVDSWEFEWEEYGPHSRGMVPESDLALFKQAVRDNVDVPEKQLTEDWLAEIDRGNEEPLVALLLLLLPNLRDVKVGSILTFSSICIHEILSCISFDDKSRSLRKLRSVNLEYVLADGDLLDFDYIRLFAALPSVTSINGFRVGGGADCLLHSPPSHLYSSDLTNLSLVKCVINPRTLVDFISTTWKLERFVYKPEGSLVDATNFDPFMIRYALLANANNTLKSLTILADGGARQFMGSLADFQRLEFLETDFACLIGDPATSWHLPSDVLPPSMVAIRLHINYTLDGSYYQASLQDIADHPKDVEQLKEITVVGVADAQASTISLKGIISVLQARGTRLSLHRTFDSELLDGESDAADKVQRI